MWSSFWAPSTVRLVSSASQTAVSRFEEAGDRARRGRLTGRSRETSHDGVQEPVWDQVPVELGLKLMAPVGPHRVNPKGELLDHCVEESDGVLPARSEIPTEDPADRGGRSRKARSWPGRRHVRPSGGRRERSTPGGVRGGGHLPYERRAGGDTWITGSYDPVLNLTYWGVAQAKPWFAVSRGNSARNPALYTSSTIALNPDTGELQWYH